MEKTYIDAVEFNDFKKNQNQLIGILNHNMTKITVDVKWLKKIQTWQVSLIAGIFAAVVAGFLRSFGVF